MRWGLDSFTEFGRKNAASVIASVVLLAIVLLMAQLSLREVQASSQWSHHAQEVRVALDDVRESLLKMETGQRGYLLTGEEPYLEPYHAGASALSGQLQKLQRLIANDEVQTERLQSLRDLAERRRAQLEYGLHLRQTGGLDAAINYLHGGYGIGIMRQVLGSLQAMSDEEGRLLAQRNEAERISLLQNFYLIVSFCTVAAVLILTMLLRVQREMRERAQAVRQLDEINSNLAEATASKTRFLSAASHDLRQPLHSLSLLNAALRGQQLSAPALAIVEAQGESLDAMSSLVNRLLNISMIESGVIRPHIEDVPLAALLTSLEVEFLSQAQARQLQLDVEPANEFVRSDPTLLREIVQNLVANAIRYTDRGRVSVRTYREGDSVIVEVSDTGRGIPEDQLERIFEEFHQVRYGNQQPREGFGLGLSIVSRLSKLLGAHIGVRSSIGAGTTFTIKQAAAVASLLPEQPSTQAESSAARFGRILLVDDEASVRNATALFLSMDGHEVRSAGSPEEALRVFAQWEAAPDVIVSDFQLNSSLNGAELIEELRKLKQSDIPAVVLSGDTMRVAPRCASIAACRVFYKPVDAEELSVHIRKVLDGAAV